MSSSENWIMQSSTEVQAPGGAAWSRQPAAATNETALSVSGHILVGMDAWLAVIQASNEKIWSGPVMKLFI